MRGARHCAASPLGESYPKRMKNPRIACVVVHLFPLAARLRSEPDLAREAVAVLDGEGGAARILAATRAARAAGIKVGQTLPQARALCPRLVARARDAQGEKSAQEALLEVAESFSPRIEDGGPGVGFLDLEGLDRRFPGSQGELDLGRALAAAMERAILPARIGIASSKLAARVAAGLPGSPVVVPAGEEAAFLAPLPLARLDPRLELAATLSRWGVRSIGELARLPKEEIASRLGSAGRDLQEIARGLDPRPLVPRQPPPDFEEGMSLEWPLVNLEPFLFIARAALDRLGQRLESSGLACRRLEIELRLEPEGVSSRTIDLPAPTRDAKTLLTLIRLEIEARPPGAPVVGFALRATPDRPREAQLSLLGPAALSPDRLAGTLARLFALLGPDRVGAPQAVDAHRPERLALVPFDPPPPPENRHSPRRGRGLLAVRALRPPIELEVIVCEGDEAETPREIRPLAIEEQERRPRILGTVTVASGPWGLEEKWWSEEAVSRDYWDVELQGGGVYRIYRERASQLWYADGAYD